MLAVVTGASRGIGQATAVELAKEGFTVVVNYNTTPPEDTLRMVQKAGGKGIPVKADMSRQEEIELMADAVREHGDLALLVNNAGIYIRSKFLDTGYDVWRRTFDVNVLGAAYLTKLVLPVMRDGGLVVFISSQLAHSGTPHGAHYASSKSALHGLVKSLALELAPRRIRVNCVAPGPVDTDIIAGDTPEKRRQREAAIPLGRVGRPEEVAQAVVYLWKAEYITGHILDVNGGYVMR